MEPSPSPQSPQDNPSVPNPASHAPGQVFGPAPSPSVPETTAPLPSPESSPSPVTPSAVYPTPAGPETYGVGGVTPLAISSSEPAKPRRRLPKSAVALVAGLFVVLGSGALAYFGYYAPNQPENLWSTALSRTGKGYDKLTDYVNKTSNSNIKGVSLDGSFKSSGAVAADGTFKGSSNDGNGEFTGSVSATGLKVNIDTRFIKSAKSTPDIYFKVDGLQGIGSLLGGGDPTLSSALDGLNNKWYFVDHTLFDQYAQGANANLDVSSKDVNELLTAIGTPTKKYIFTADSKNSALTLKQKLGKEKQDSRDTYHYKVGVNKTNLKAYNNALCDSLKNTKIFKLVSSGDASETLKSCKDTTDLDKIKDSQTADVWVDTHTKLIHKVRFSDASDASKYFDIGQDYQGGDSLPFFIASHDKTGNTTSDGRFDISLNMKTNTLTLSGKFKDSGDSKDSFTLDLKISPNSSNVKVEKPDGAKSIIELANDLGLGELFSGTQTTAKDTERKTDIRAMQGHIEAYYANNGQYPTLANINDPSWVGVNMKGLDAAAFQDPDGNSHKLSASPAVHVYSYQPAPAGCNNTTVQCTGYSLTATLDDGSPFSVQSDNSDAGLPVVNL